MRPPAGKILPGRTLKTFHCGPNPNVGSATLHKIVVLYGDSVIKPLDVHTP
jgi:hypothetical protein